MGALVGGGVKPGGAWLGGGGRAIDLGVDRAPASRWRAAGRAPRPELPRVDRSRHWSRYPRTADSLPQPAFGLDLRDRPDRALSSCTRIWRRGAGPAAMRRRR